MLNVSAFILNTILVFKSIQCVCAHVSVCVFVSITSPGVVVRRHSVCGLDIRVEGGLEVEQVTGEIWHAGETRAERDRDKKS